MDVIEEIHDFLLWALLNAWIPTSALFLLKALGYFPLAGKWVLLPWVSVSFFPCLLLCRLGSGNRGLCPGEEEFEPLIEPPNGSSPYRHH